MRSVGRAPRLRGAPGLLLALLAGIALLAPHRLGASTPKQWNKGLQQALTHLRAGEWPAAKTSAQKVLDAMIDDMAPGRASDHGVGLMLMIRALAEAGLGDEPRAAWDWQLAQQFDPRLEAHDLSEFGAAGALLDRHRLKNDPIPEALQPGEGSGITAPERVEASFPRYSEAMRALGMQGRVELLVVVHEDGTLSHPRLGERLPVATMVLAAAESIRNSRFRPAMRDGQPVRIHYTFTLGFRLTY